MESGGIMREQVQAMKGEWADYTAILWRFGFSNRFEVWETYCKMVGRDPSNYGETPT